MTESETFKRVSELDGLAVLLRGTNYGPGTSVNVVEFYDEAGQWLANVFRLDDTAFGPVIYPNSRHATLLDPRRTLLTEAAIEFRNDIRNGKVTPCLEQHKRRDPS